ncbi:MAG: PTS sugar transporter subunit IIA [Anaerolineae bacterium]
MSRAGEVSRGATPGGAAGDAGSTIGLLVVTHADLGKGLVQAAEMIVGPLNGVATLSLNQGESLEELRQRLANAIGNLDSGSGVLVMLDLFGGTPANAAALALDRGRVEAVAGVNLPMLVEAIQHREAISLPTLAARIADAGKGGIRDLRADHRERPRKRAK